MKLALLRRRWPRSLLAAPAQASTVSASAACCECRPLPASRTDDHRPRFDRRRRGSHAHARSRLRGGGGVRPGHLPGRRAGGGRRRRRQRPVRIEAFLPSDLHGGAGDDELSGGPLNDVLAGDSGRDFADGGEGDDRILLRDSKLDSALCGGGRDNVRAEVLDYLDYACETVDLGPPGRVGRLRPSRRPKRFVKIPGQNGEKIDRRILANVV